MPVGQQEPAGMMAAIGMIGQVKALAREVGGWEQLEALIALLRD